MSDRFPAMGNEMLAATAIKLTLGKFAVKQTLWLRSKELLLKLGNIKGNVEVVLGFRDEYYKWFDSYPSSLV